MFEGDKENVCASVRESVCVSEMERVYVNGRGIECEREKMCVKGK